MKADTELTQLAKTDRNPVQETRYQELMKSQGSTGGGVESIDLSKVPSALEYAKTLEVPEDAALREIVNTMRAQEKPLDIYGRLETEAGIPQLRATSTTLSKAIASMEDYLDRIEPDVSARTRESLVTEAQRSGMVASEKKPWIEKLGKYGTSLGRVQNAISEGMQGIGTKTQLAIQGQQQEIEPLKLYYSALVDRNARKMSGFTTDRATQLDVLFDKLNRTRQLSDMEWQQANELAQEERTYVRALQTSAAGAGVELTGDESTDQLLSLIGTTAAEAIAYDRAQKAKTGGTSSDRKTAVALTALQGDIKNYETFENLVRRYGDTVPLYQIRQEYDAFHTGTGGEPWGPASESENTVQSWTKEPAKTETTGIDEVALQVSKMKEGNVPNNTIVAYIISKGYKPADFGY